MKTAIRSIQVRTEDTRFELYRIEILISKYKRRDMKEYLEPIGYIQFQREFGSNENYYAMSFKVDSQELRHFESMTKIIRLIKKEYSHGIQPIKVKEIIGAQEHVLYQHEFVPITKHAHLFYKIMRKGEYYQRLIVESEAEANKAVKKIKLDGLTAEFQEQIDLMSLLDS